jgi:hypothetical protein
LGCWRARPEGMDPGRRRCYAHAVSAAPRSGIEPSRRLSFQPSPQFPSHRLGDDSLVFFSKKKTLFA